MAKKTTPPVSTPSTKMQDTDINTNTLPNDSLEIRRIKIQQTPKLSPKAPGHLTYALGIDDHTQDLYLQLQDNSSGGFFSREWVPLSHIDACIARLKPKEVFAASHFRPAFISRSQNNAGFLAAALKAEGVIIAVPEQLNGLQVDSVIYSQWRSTLLVLAKDSTGTINSTGDHSQDNQAETDDEVLDQVMVSE